MIDEAAPPWVRADSAALERALDRLSALTRSVLWLYHVEGYAHSEIAEQLGKTISFSKSQVARGTARLRELLDGGPAEPSRATAEAPRSTATPGTAAPPQTLARLLHGEPSMPPTTFVENPL